MDKQEFTINKYGDYTEIFMDYYYGARIFLLDKQIIFCGNGYAKDIVFLSMRGDMFNNFNKGYLESKMKQFLVSKKDIKFYLGMIDFLKENKN